MGDRPTAPAQQSLQLILARNLISTLSTPAFLVDTEGTVVFYNEPAGEVAGIRYEETGKLPLSEWRANLDLADEADRPIPEDELPATVAVRERRPVHATATMRIAGAKPQRTELLALPLIGPEETHEGAVGVFWVRPDSAA